MSPILLATDLSPWCDRAKERALWLAGRDGRPLTILYVTDGDPARARAEIAEMARAEAPGLAPDIVVRSGPPWEEINAEVARVRPGLLILGRHRRDALKDFFLSPTASLLESGPPVLQAINLPAGPWSDVVVGTDFSPLAQRALTVALELAPEARIHLMHVFEVPFAGFITNPADAADIAAPKRQDLESAAARAIAAAGGGTRQVDIVLARGAVIPTLHTESARLGADLVVLGVGGGGGQAFGGTARALTIDPPCDLLVVPPDGE